MLVVDKMTVEETKWGWRSTKWGWVSGFNLKCYLRERVSDFENLGRQIGWYRVKREILGGKFWGK